MIFQMSRRNYTAITIVIVILFFDVLVYKYQSVNCSNVMLPRSCSPPRPPDKAGQVVPSETPALHVAGEKFN
jgi:hypothetical protein